MVVWFRRVHFLFFLQQNWFSALFSQSGTFKRREWGFFNSYTQWPTFSLLQRWLQISVKLHIENCSNFVRGHSKEWPREFKFHNENVHLAYISCQLQEMYYSSCTDYFSIHADAHAQKAWKPPARGLTPLRHWKVYILVTIEVKGH